LQAAGENVLLAMRWPTCSAGISTSTTTSAATARGVFERQLSEGEFAGYGPIVAAEFRNEGRTLRAFRFANAEGKASYYDAARPVR